MLRALLLDKGRDNAKQVERSGPELSVPRSCAIDCSPFWTHIRCVMVKIHSDMCQCNCRMRTLLTIFHNETTMQATAPTPTNTYKNMHPKHGIRGVWHMHPPRKPNELLEQVSGNWLLANLVIRSTLNPQDLLWWSLRETQRPSKTTVCIW